jgi:hypothetical protein
MLTEKKQDIFSDQNNDERKQMDSAKFFVEKKNILPQYGSDNS